jgi:hypothetical protein
MIICLSILCFAQLIACWVLGLGNTLGQLDIQYYTIVYKYCALYYRMNRKFTEN